MAAHKIALEAVNVAQAIEETITTPSPGLGHGRIADVAALITFTLSTLHIVAL
jgi:hypothetical protein